MATVLEGMASACAKVGIHGYTIHDHRHTAAVHLARSGMPLGLLQNQLGHATIAMTMKYATFHPKYADVGTYFDNRLQNDDCYEQKDRAKPRYFSMYAFHRRYLQIAHFESGPT